MRELLVHRPIFIGFKADTSLRELLESLSDTNKKYISAEGSTFLRICRVGEDIYVGTIIHESLTTDQVDDIRHNVLSVMRKIRHEGRLPSDLAILACSAADTDSLPADGKPVP